MNWAIPANRECDPNSDSQRPIVVELCEQMNDVLVGGVALPKTEKNSVSWSSRSGRAFNHQSVASVGSIQKVDRQKKEQDKVSSES